MTGTMIAMTERDMLTVVDAILYNVTAEAVNDETDEATADKLNRACVHLENARNRLLEAWEGRA